MYMHSPKIPQTVDSNVEHLPGNKSFRFAGGLLESRVSLCSAFLTGKTGFMTNANGNLAVPVATRGAPVNAEYLHM